MKLASREAPKNCVSHNYVKQNRKFQEKCYNCENKGHVAKDYWSNKKDVESNIATSNLNEKIEEDWDVKASFAMEKEELSLIITLRE